ncbi:hypothetical protein A9Q99_00705 [Gammaproteobacteria bacterium 45_16_T64]|nr:hypothetical protein A9Q99_00705 [Gammaproteobacteria bacterium 45_16_T64]
MFSAGIFTLLQSPELKADTYVIDNEHSSIRFSIDHLGISRTTGRFGNISGVFSFDPSRDIATAKTKVFVKTQSIDTNNDKRDALLRGFSFFNVTKHPVAMFKSTSLTQHKSNSKTGRVTGELTLAGHTHTEIFDVEFTGEGRDPWLGYRMGFIAKGSIKRSDYELDFMAGAIGNDVSLEIFVEGVKK